jgi:hypothetical protein
MPLMPAIKTNHISGEKSPHYRSKGHLPGAKEKMGMIRKQCPPITGRFG